MNRPAGDPFLVCQQACKMLSFARAIEQLDNQVESSINDQVMPRNNAVPSSAANF